MTDRKRAAAARSQRRQRDALPLLAPPMYLLDLLHGFSKGRLLIKDGQVCPAAVAIPVSQAIAAFGPPKPVAGG